MLRAARRPARQIPATRAHLAPVSTATPASTTTTPTTRSTQPQAVQSTDDQAVLSDQVVAGLADCHQPVDRLPGPHQDHHDADETHPADLAAPLSPATPIAGPPLGRHHPCAAHVHRLLD